MEMPGNIKVIDMVLSHDKSILIARTSSYDKLKHAYYFINLKSEASVMI